MDLSHLVTVGLWSASKQPLSPADIEYFQKHKVDAALAEIVTELSASKPADPFAFIAQKASTLAEKKAGGEGAEQK
eukprot:1163273-Amphidinium_carterae.1